MTTDKIRGWVIRDPRGHLMYHTFNTSKSECRKKCTKKGDVWLSLYEQGYRFAIIELTAAEMKARRIKLKPQNTTSN